MNQNQVNLEPEEPLLPSPSSEMLAYMEKLYPLIFAFKQTKLWKSIRDSEPFAIQMPDGQTGCCILTGNEGDFISLSIYFGDAGWNSICNFYSEPVETEEARLEQMMSQSCVQVVFCRKDGLTETEVQSLRHYARENNIAFRGKNAYFCLRNSEPYHCSWFLETKEQADILELGLRAALDLHKQLGQGKTPAELGISSCIDTLPLYDGKTWSTMMPPERTVSSLTEPLLSDAMQQKIRRMKKGGGKWECQLFPFSSPVLAKEGAPFFPFLLMILDTKREQLLPQAATTVQRRYSPKGTGQLRTGNYRLWSLPQEHCRLRRANRSDPLGAVSQMRHSPAEDHPFCHAGRGEGIFSGGYGSRKTGRRCRVGKNDRRICRASERHDCGGDQGRCSAGRDPLAHGVGHSGGSDEKAGESHGGTAVI